MHTFDLWTPRGRYQRRGGPRAGADWIAPIGSTSAASPGGARLGPSASDEALRHSRRNAAFMRNECGIMECLEHRQRSTALLPWRIEPEDLGDSRQQAAAALLTRLLQRMPGFLEYRRNLLEALWYGRYACQIVVDWTLVDGRRFLAPRRWLPVHGDKLVFHPRPAADWAEDGVGLRIGRVGQVEAAGRAFPRERLATTGSSRVYYLDAAERKRLAVHQHLIEDGEFHDPVGEDALRGVGIRSRIYWTWFSMQECLALMMEFVERSALGVEIWPYHSGNPESKARVEQAALDRVGGGRSVILAPVLPGEPVERLMPQHIEPGMQGVSEIKDLITRYFGHKIKRYILGQTLTSEADATGLGSGLAETHLATYQDIIRYDSQKLAETLTHELVAPLVEWNFPELRGACPRLVIDAERPDVEGTLRAWRDAHDLGLAIDPREIAALVGVALAGSQPEADHAV